MKNIIAITMYYSKNYWYENDTLLIEYYHNVYLFIMSHGRYTRIYYVR